MWGVARQGGGALGGGGREAVGGGDEPKRNAGRGGGGKWLRRIPSGPNGGNAVSARGVEWE